MAYIVKDLDDCELGRANDARSAWDLVEVEWPDAVATSLSGPPVRVWVKLAAVPQDAGAVVIMVHGRAVGGVEIKSELRAAPLP